jgi:hypothetical protein
MVLEDLDQPVEVYDGDICQMQQSACAAFGKGSVRAEEPGLIGIGIEPQFAIPPIGPGPPPSTRLRRLWPENRSIRLHRGRGQRIQNWWTFGMPLLMLKTRLFMTHVNLVLLRKSHVAT